MLARHWLFRVSVAINLLVLVYLALYSTSTTTSYSPPSSPPAQVSDLSSSSLSSNDLQPQELKHSKQIRQPPEEEAAQLPVKRSSENEEVNPQQLVLLQKQQAGEELNGGGESDSEAAKEIPNPPPEVEFPEQGSGALINPGESQNSQGAALDGRKKIFPCDDMIPRTYYGQRGPFWVLYNYITAERTFGCDQSITYTTHSDFTFLDNLIPLIERWQGPISLSMYAPGTDFSETLSRILWLRECAGTPLIKEFVNFHIFFDHKHIPKQKVPLHPMDVTLNCSAIPIPSFGEDLPTYKKSRKLPYPVNVARNSAREMSTTHYVLPSDIELYPNPNLINDFLDMIKRNDEQLQRPNPKVFVLSIFEVEANVTSLPKDKLELLEMLKNKSAIPFHKYVCADCHRIPKSKEWISAKYEPGVRVFHIGKRHKPYHHWEPIYIGSKLDPLYDERLTWEGRSDKMTQGYVLCVLDYEFHILDNAFLVHRPGIKRTVIIPSKNPVVSKQNKIISQTILPELKLIYGSRPGCFT